MNEYSSLEDFFGYLHQDWADDYPTVWDVLKSYLSDVKLAHEVALTARIPPEISRLLSECPTEDQLAEACWRLGAYYVASWDGGTYRGWLRELSARVEAWLRANPADGGPPRRLPSDSEA